MHKVLIVEDDVMYRYAVKSLLDCTDGALRLLPEAINGKHALAIMEAERPDIIITDISMAEMGGVELIKRVKASWPEIKILALSAYDDFAFVKDALKYGAEDYILKYELEKADLDAVVRALGEKIDRERRQRHRDGYILDNWTAILEDFLGKTLLGELRDPREIGRSLECLFPDRERSLFAVAVLGGSGTPGAVAAALQGMAAELAACRFAHLAGRDLVAVLVNLSGLAPGEEARAGLASLARRIVRRVEHATGLRTDMAVSRPTADLGELAGRFREAEELLGQRFYDDGSRVFLQAPDGRETDPSFFRPRVDSILAALETGDAPGAAGALQGLFRMLGERRPDMETLDATVVELLGGFLAAAKRRQLDFRALTGMDRCPRRALDVAPSLEGLEKALYAWFDAFLEAGRRRPVSCRREVVAAMDYLRRNFRSDVQLCEIAESLHLSPNYLSGVFRKETGMRLFEFLKKVRIEEAVRLLKTTDLKVYEIADRTGFHAVPYFCRSFREVTGRPLSAFRRDPD